MNSPVLPKPPAFSPAALERRLAEIRRVVAEHFGIERAALTSRARTEPLATIRQLAMFLAREATGASFMIIARSFARGDHETVRQACKAVDEKTLNDEKLAEDLAALRAKLQPAPR